MRNAIRLSGLLIVILLASQLGGCSSSGARPTYHMSTSNSYYWGGYGYRRGYYGGYSGRGYVGRPTYYGGRYRRY